MTKFITNTRNRNGEFHIAKVSEAVEHTIEDSVDPYAGQIETLESKVEAMIELLGRAYAQLDKHGLLDEETLKEIKPFYWEATE